MANTRAVIDIDINTSAAAAGLRQLQSQITAFNSTLTKSSAVQATAMRNSTSNMLELVNASRFFTGETVRMQTAAASLDTTLKKGQGTLGTFLGAKFRKNSLAAAQVMSLANTRAQALQTQFVATGAAANGMRDAIAIRPLQAFNNAAVVSAQKLAIHRAMLNQATTSMINFGKNTQWTGRQLMVGFTVPLTIFGGVAGKVFRDLEKEAVNFKKVYGDSFTPPEEMEANLNAVKELAKEYTKYGIAVKDTVGLAAEAAAAGAQNAELIDATTQATRLATLGQMEQNEALKTTISLQNAFKLSGDELANSINFLNMVENQTVVTLQDLSGAIPRVAPVIKGLGGDVRDLATFLAAMQEGGVSAAQGSMALKSGLASLINPTEKAKERLAEMGISIDTIIQANKGDLMGTVQALATALDTLDQFGRQQAIEELFGKFQYARLAALFDNINKEGTQASRVMEISAMSAAEMAASAEKELGAIEEAVGTKFVAAMEQLKLAIAPIGEIFTKMAIPVINFLAKIADAFNNLPDGAKTFIGIATAIVGIVIPAGTMFLGLLVNLIGTLVKFGSAIGTAFRGFLSGGIKGAFDAVSQSTKYMSLADIDAANSAQQLAGSTEAVNKALLGQVGSSESAQAAVMELAYAYEILTQQMREAAVQNQMVFGTGAVAMGAAGPRGPRVRRNRGGTIPGSGNTDTVPAMLTPGEFVVNKQATRENLPILKEINKGGMLPGFAGGGLLAMQMIARGLPSLTGTIGRTAVSLPARAAGGARSRISSKLYSRYQEEKGQTKNARLMRYAVEELGIDPSELRLSTRSSYGFLLSREANESMKKGTLNSALLSSELLQSGALSPLRTQLSKNLGHLLDEKRFIEILNQQVARTSKRGLVSNKSFEQASGRALAMYLSETNIPITSQRSFMRGVFKKTELSANLSRERLKQSLDARGVSYREDGKNLYAMLDNGTEINLGNLTGREMGIFSKPAGFARSRSYKIKGDPRVFAHGRNAGGGIPGRGGKVPAMLTPGEFVVNKDAAQSNMAFLNAINNGTLRGYELGGVVEALPGQYLVEGRNGRTFGPMSYSKAIQRSKQLVSARARRGMVARRGGGAAGMMAGRGMGMSMGMGMIGSTAMMGGMMLPGVSESPALSGAISAGGMGLSMLSMLPMLGVGGPVTLAIAGVAAAATAAGVALYKWRDSVDTASRKAAEFGANLGGTANALNNISSIMGQQTPSQRKAQLQLSEKDVKVLDENAQQFQAIFSSEEGQAFIKDLTDATSAERFQKLSDYLKYAIASGLMDTQVAQSFAKGISSEIGDAVLGTQVSTALRGQRAGAAGLVDLAEKRISDSTTATSKALQETVLSHTDASKAIGSATQIIQDFANAEALAREQFASGEITYEQMQEIINQATDAQSRYNDVIEAAIDKTDDLGGTMQATIQQMVNAGTITEEGFKELEKIAYSQQGPALTPQQVSESENVLADLMDAEAAVINGTAIAVQKFDPEELMAAQISAIQSGISLANVQSIGEEIASGRGPVFDIYSEQVGLGKSGFAAFETAMNAQAISSLVGQTQRRGPGGAVSAREVARDIAIRFDASGGDTEALQRIIASLPESGTKRIDFLVNFDLMTPQQQQKFLSDSQELSSMFGEQFANTLQASDEYKTALEKGSTQIFKDNLAEAKAVFGDSTEDIYNYANKVKIPLTELTEKGQAIADLPDELAFKLGVEATNIEDLEKFGPMADELGEAWPILQKLPESFNLKAFVEANTSKNGELASPKELADEMILIKNSLADLDSTKPEVVKKAVVDILVSHGGTEADAQSAFSDILGNMEEFNDFQLEDKMAVVGIMVKYMEDVDALSEATKTAMNLQGGGAMRGLTLLQEAVNESAEAAQIAMQSARVNMAGTDRGSSSGGGGQKSLMQQLRERAKLAKDFEDAISGRRVQRVASKPLGGEFIEYLKSQGKPGLKLLKAATTDVKKFTEAYKLFRQEQRSDTKATLDLMPQALAQELKTKKTTLKLTKAVSKELKVNGDIATEIVGSLDEGQQKMVLQDISSGKISDNTKAILNNAKNLSQFNSTNANYLKFMAMSAEELQQSMRDLASEANDIRRQIAEIDIIRPLQDQLDAQQKIDDGLSRQIELKQRLINDLGRQIELEQRSIDGLDEQIEKYEEQKDQINDSYDQRIEALEKIENINERIAAQQEGQLSIASALSRGDIAAAAEAALELKREQAQQQVQDAKDAIELSRKEQIEQVENNINVVREQREAIESRIENLQRQQRDIQDDIYDLEQKRIPVQDEIYRLNIKIANETERLDDAYRNATIEAESLRAKLREVEQAAIAAARAARDAGVATPPSVTGGSGITNVNAAGGFDLDFSNADPAMFAELSKTLAEADFSGLGNLGPLVGIGMMYGGNVNYKGSKEKAPGFMYGGKMKKYAYGSSVPGIGMTDKVPALLTPGEFVVRKSVAEQYGPLLNAINSNVFPKMGGSAMPKSSKNSSDGIQYNYDIDVNVAGTNASPDEIAKAVMYRIKRIDDRQVRGTRLG